MRLIWILTGDIHQAFWFHHGSSGDPYKFFNGMETDPRVRLQRAISDYADSESINRDRGHEEPWEYEAMNGCLVLFKYKSKSFVERFFAIVHDHPEGRRSVIVHGFKGHQGKRKEQDDPRYQREKKKAEERAKQYLEWIECRGAVQ